ncbi:alpha-ketoglutarate-dependent dioxygenase AlkB [Pseudoalteromonas piscicida]|uniref:DNA repair protein n=1 Tax=Pseudoalteromonas piscicida TaxID=43662 RepID=A0A2A5JP45_PSEO7|nr:alpha-ketoglutarate-dependent dioxygenase AlkB [Pseudoalteromonas piscicida]PCK31188.1 DNA repair protein [Pseudoalteromonas piscicida]
MKLPLQCEAQYIQAFLSDKDEQTLFDWLNRHCDLDKPEAITLANGEQVEILPWKMMFVEPRLIDPDIFPQCHGRRQAWPPVIESIQQQLQQKSGIEFDVCVCIYYPNGEEYMDFHSDLPAFGPTDVIASLSIGAERTFQIRREQNHEEQLTLTLESGSLLIMGKGFQALYQHAVPRAPETLSARFNLTFRQFNWPTHTNKNECR